MVNIVRTIMEIYKHIKHVESDQSPFSDDQISHFLTNQSINLNQISLLTNKLDPIKHLSSAASDQSLPPRLLSPPNSFAVRPPSPIAVTVCVAAVYRCASSSPTNTITVVIIVVVCGLIATVLCSSSPTIASTTIVIITVRRLTIERCCSPPISTTVTIVFHRLTDQRRIAFAGIVSDNAFWRD